MYQSILLSINIFYIFKINSLNIFIYYINITTNDSCDIFIADVNKKKKKNSKI